MSKTKLKLAHKAFKPWHPLPWQGPKPLGHLAERSNWQILMFCIFPNPLLELQIVQYKNTIRQHVVFVIFRILTFDKKQNMQSSRLHTLKMLNLVHKQKLMQTKYPHLSVATLNK